MRRFGPNFSDVRVSCTELRNKLMKWGERCGVDEMVVCVSVDMVGTERSNKALSVMEPVM